MTENKNTKNHTIERIGGYLHKIVPIVDKTGKIISHTIIPLQIELKARDIFQIIVGSYLLCVPVAFTEEVWVLSEELPLINIYYICLLTYFFIGCFVYYNFYCNNLSGNWWHFIKRVHATHFVSFVAVGLFLTLIQKCPWGIDNLLAIKRIILVTFPASMAATMSDTIK